MKLADARVYVVPPEVSVSSWVNGEPWVLVELRTACGLSGWGHAHTTLYGREFAIARNVQDLAQKLMGRSPFSIRQFMSEAREQINASAAGIEMAAAAAGIEIALWDIAGKALDAPVHKLLGGACKARVALYANCWSNEVRSPEEFAEFALAQAQRGVRAVKVYPFLHDVSVEHGLACISAIREAVGADVFLFVDMLNAMPCAGDGRLFEALRAHDVCWLEDPAPTSSADELQPIRERAGIPVVAGEELYSRQAFARLCEADAVDILNPEVALLGILGVQDIAVIADAYDRQIAVHNANTMTIGLAAALHAAAITPNSHWVEYFPTLEAGSNSFSSLPLDLDSHGTVAPPEGPGLGVHVDASRLENYLVQGLGAASTLD